MEEVTTCIDVTFCGAKYCIEIPADLNDKDVQTLKSFISKALVTAKWSQFDELIKETEACLESTEMKELFQQGFWYEILQIRNSVEPKLIEDMKTEQQTEVPQNNKWIKRGIYAAIGLGVVFGALKLFKK